MLHKERKDNRGRCNDAIAQVGCSLDAVHFIRQLNEMRVGATTRSSSPSFFKTFPRWRSASSHALCRAGRWESEKREGRALLLLLVLLVCSPSSSSATLTWPLSCPLCPCQWHSWPCWYLLYHHCPLSHWGFSLRSSFSHLHDCQRLGSVFRYWPPSLPKSPAAFWQDCLSRMLGDLGLRWRGSVELAFSQMDSSSLKYLIILLHLDFTILCKCCFRDCVLFLLV